MLEHQEKAWRSAVAVDAKKGIIITLCVEREIDQKMHSGEENPVTLAETESLEKAGTSGDQEKLTFKKYVTG